MARDETPKYLKINYYVLPQREPFYLLGMQVKEDVDSQRE